MKYAPKARRKWNLKIIIPLLIVAIIMVTFGVQNLLQDSEDEKKYTVCGFTHEKSKERLEKKYEQTYTLSDYMFYGESLNLYKDTYNATSVDDLAGKSVILKDVCSSKEYSYVIRSTIDSQIVMNNLTEGFFEVYVVEDLIEKRVVFSGNVNDSITTLQRNGKRHEVNLLANSDYYNEREIKMDQNYLFIKVSESKDDDLYDIAIDPAANDKDYTWTVNKGSEGNGLVEYQETYKAAQLLKEKLEANGLKVLIVRNENEEINSYGEDGRLERAYNAKAKYYIKLHFEESDLDYDGMDIYYSGHSNGSFSKQIIYYLSRNSSVKLSSVYNISDPGNIQCMLYEGMDGRTVYDANLAIREAGGKATQAGMYSENAQKGTASFAKDNVYGMNAISINLGYLTSKSDVDYWLNHREEYMNALSAGIISYLNLKQE